MIACENSGHNITCDFPEVRKIVKAGATEKPVLDYELTRYACYLIVHNGDPRKEVIALIGALIGSFASKTVYICPDCGAEFESKDKITLTTGWFGFRRSLTTCPKCKKTFFAVLKESVKPVIKKPDGVVLLCLDSE